jgi:hypothetical protein
LNSWLQIKKDYYILHYRPNYDKDAQIAAEYFDRAIRSLINEFLEHDSSFLLKYSICQIYLFSSPTEKAKEGYATTITKYVGNKLNAEIHILALSAHNPSDKTNVGEPMDENYFFKTIVHEYSIIILELLTRKKTKGWTFYDSPDWFHDGYEEYLSLMRSSKHSKEVTFIKYLNEIKNIPSHISWDNGIKVHDRYIDGSILISFLHDKFGKKQTQAILRSAEATFNDAFAKTFGIDLHDFYEYCSQRIPAF